MTPPSVFVINRNKEPHRDRYDGEEFLFLPDQPTAISVPAAEHMLGYKLKDKTSTLQRLGKAFRYNPTTKAFEDNADGVKWLAKFQFEEAVLQPASALAQALKALPEVKPALSEQARLEQLL